MHNINTYMYVRYYIVWYSIIWYFMMTYGIVDICICMYTHSSYILFYMFILCTPVLLCSLIVDSYLCRYCLYMTQLYFRLWYIYILSLYIIVDMLLLHVIIISFFLYSIFYIIVSYCTLFHIMIYYDILLFHIVKNVSVAYIYITTWSHVCIHTHAGRTMWIYIVVLYVLAYICSMPS